VPSIGRRLINFCWFWFKWGLIACVVGAALMVPYFYHRLDGEIRNRVQALLAAQYPNLTVKIRSAARVQGEGITIRGLSVLDPAAEGPGAELLTYDECSLACPTDLNHLLSEQMEITRVTLRRPTLRMTRRADGTWSTSKLLPMPRFGTRPPEVTVENGTIEIFDPTKTPSSTLTLRDVNLTLVPCSETSGGSGALAVPHAQGDAAAAPANASAAPSRVRKVRGTLSGDYFRQATFEGEVDTYQPAFSLSGSIEGMELSPEFCDALPGSLLGSPAILGTLRGQAALSFHVRYDPRDRNPLRFDLTGHLLHGRIDDPRLPHPLTEMRALVHVTNEGFAIEDLSARSNQATLVMSCQGAGLRPQCPLRLKAEIQQLELDSRLLDVLPERLQEQWHKFRPEGQVDAEMRLDYDGRNWNPEVLLRCVYVSFTHHKFPYRLDHGKGELHLKDNVLVASLTGLSENQPVRIDGELRDPLSGPWGWVEAKGESLSIDEKLVSALPSRSQAVTRALDLRGKLGFRYRLWRDSAAEPFHQYLAVRASRCWLRYEHFPFSLANVRCDLEMIDGNWQIRELEGNNGACRVVGEGSLTATPAGPQLFLALRATTVSLEQELRDALPQAMRQVWGLLQPRGIIDLAAEVRYSEAANQLDVSVRAEPRSETCSIEPVSFPYRLEKVQGVLSYRSGRVTIEHFRAEHGAVKVAAGSGSCQSLPDGGWQLRLDALTVDRLRLDRELMQALPARIKKILGELCLSGLIHVRGSLDVARGGGLDDPIRSQWDVAVGLQQVGIDSGLRLENIHGSLSLAGGFDGQSFGARGELGLDSLSFKDHQFTDVLGPLWIDDQQLLLGSWVDRRPGQAPPGGLPPKTPRPVTAMLLGGKLYGDAWVALGPHLRYGVQATLVDADLARAAHEIAANRENLHGRVSGSIELGGSGHSTQNLAGRGSLRLQEGDVYELPLMVAMLKLLGIRAPDQRAVSHSDVDFRIEGEHFYFDRIHFTGDVISLDGKGEMNFQGETRLRFTAQLGRGDLGIPALHKFFTTTSGQIMQINVRGTLQNPDIQKEAFPGVNHALQQLQDHGSAPWPQ
jgi:hypothetical protein